jgi:phosphoglycolate phosphatase
VTATIRGVLFDKDGTLADFAGTWPPAYRAAAAELARAAGDPALSGCLLRLGGYDAEGVLDPGSVLACGTTEDLVALWAARPELADVTDVIGRVDRVFLEFASRAPAVTADLAALLGRLRDGGLTLGVATNDGAEAARAWLAHAGIDHLIDFAAGADSGHGGKPGPGMMMAFCAAAGVAAAEVAVVGDAASDLRMARAGGAGLAVGVLTGVTGHEALAPLADHVLASVAEIETILPDRAA